MSQLDLALEAEVSQKHLSFVESGRATPSREMVLHLAERLDVPRRERNVLLVAAGYAPMFRERTLDDNAMSAARDAIARVLTAHEPYPALAIDRHWNMIAANKATPALMGGVADASLLHPPVNVLRLSLHPRGLAPRIENYPEWRAHLLERLGRQIGATGDETLLELMREISDFRRRAGPSQPLVRLRATTFSFPCASRRRPACLN
jgi:transcriptional regulator with XRE-family HTH domain